MKQQYGAFLDTPALAPGVTRFWMIRHALVEENARARLYGSTDVPLCPESLVSQTPMYESLAARLPRDAVWITTPLSRTRITAEHILKAGYPHTEFGVEPDLIEQSMGAYHGLEHHRLPERLGMTPHPFWPMAAEEVPPGGESMDQMLLRVGGALERLADRHDRRDIVSVSHGGTIRMACAHALDISAGTALRLSVQNLSLTILERHPASWRVVTINELPGA